MAELRKELSLEQRQLVRDALQGTSRKEVLKAIVPQAGKIKKPQAKKKLSFSKKFKLSVKKKQMNKLVRRLKVDKVPLPDAPTSALVALPEEAPTSALVALPEEAPMSALVALPEEAPPSGIFRVVTDALGESCYGLTGTLQKTTATDGLLLPLKQKKSQWVPRNFLHQLSAGEHKKVWKRKQFSVSRERKREMLLNMGCLRLEVDGDEEVRQWRL